MNYILVKRDEENEWRWNLYDGKGDLVAKSGKGYQNKTFVAERARELHPGIDVKVILDQ